VAQFKRGDFYISDASHPWRPTTEIIDQIQELILKDCRISPTSIAEQLRISRERVRSIIYKDFEVRKIAA